MTGGRTSWREASFVVVDVETSGLDPRRDEVLSFAAVPVEGGRILPGATVSGLVRPERAPPASSIEIHGLRAADLASAKPAPEALEPLAAALSGRVPVAHAAWVERGFLRPPLRELGFPLARRMVDTVVLWRALCIARGASDPGLWKLSAIAGALELPSHRPHVAEGDALTTAQVFLALATHFEGRGRGTVRDLTGADRRVRAYRLWHPRLSRLRSG